jgi:hypothetical protein
VEAIVQKGHRLPLGALIGLFISNQAFDLVSEEAADRRLTTRSKNPRLPEYLPTEAYGYVLLLFIS